MFLAHWFCLLMYSPFSFLKVIPISHRALCSILSPIWLYCWNHYLAWSFWWDFIKEWLIVGGYVTNILEDPGASIFFMKLRETVLSEYKPCVATAALVGTTLYEVCLILSYLPPFRFYFKGEWYLIATWILIDHCNWWGLR